MASLYGHVLREHPDLLVMHVIFQHISISRWGCLSMVLEGS